MDNNSLLKISLTLSIIGILFLLILANITPPKVLRIKDISSKYLDKKIQTKGTIINIKSYKETDFQVIKIQDNTKTIDITLNPLQNITINQSITVIGTIRRYKDALQIQVDKITA